VTHRLLVKDQHGEREVLLVDTLAVGRDPRCDITAPDPQLSRRHAEFVADGAEVRVRDLDSRNGILVNGRRLPEAELHPGDVVQVAQVVVTFLSRLEAETVVAHVLAGEASSQAPEPTRGDETTTLLNTDQVQAVARASAIGRSIEDAGQPGNGSGAKKSGAWSVRVVHEDDRTNLLPPAAAAAAEAPTDPDCPAAPSGENLATATSATTTAAVLAPPPVAVVPAPAAVAAATVQPSRRPAPPATAAIVAATASFAVGCFTLGAAATMIWLGPWWTLEALMGAGIPVSAAAAGAVVLAAGGAMGLVISRFVRRAKSD
jgi:hypothetical protein